MDLARLLLPRIHFAIGIAFHIIFPAFTVGLAAWLATIEEMRLAIRFSGACSTFGNRGLCDHLCYPLNRRPACVTGVTRPPTRRIVPYPMSEKGTAVQACFAG